jgi:NAD-dependent dihydropyrimidine dehydrogenase PreA subunit
MISTLPLLCFRQARAMCQPCVSSAPVHGLALSGVSRSRSAITAWAADCHSAGICANTRPVAAKVISTNMIRIFTVKLPQ